MRKLENEQDRKKSITISVSSVTMQQLHQFQRQLGMNRSETIRLAVKELFERELNESTDMDDFPDEVSEVGYDPFMGSYSEDL